MKKMLFMLLACTALNAVSAVDFTSLTASDDGYLGTNDIREITIYTGITANCPSIEGLEEAYVLEVVVAAAAFPNETTDMYTRDIRCGTGDTDTYIDEISTYLEHNLGFSQINREQLYTLTQFADLTALNVTVGTEEQTVIIETPTNYENTHSNNQQDELVIPNTTNTVNFEIKATGPDGEILADWGTQNLEINSSVDIHFRWDNVSDYSQCLLFLADNGQYSLTRSDSFTIGNTENQGFNIFERTGEYRIECAGQTNGEFGADVRGVEVILI